MSSDPYRYFRVEAREIADQLGQGLLDLEKRGGDDAVVGRLLRLAHTLKGAARVVRQPQIADQAHAIEDALAPLRGMAGFVPADDINAVLRLVDGIAGRVAALTPPSAEGIVAVTSAPATVAPPAAEVFRVVRADFAEVDALLERITETYMQARPLADATAVAERAMRLADAIASQDSRAAAATDELRAALSRLVRNLALTQQRIGRELDQVRETAEQLRLVPAASLFPPLERAARDAAQALGKQIVFEGRGGETRLDAHVARGMQEALLQMVRNAVAHGIEAPRDRLAARKPSRGRVAIDVARRGKRIVFRCSDDGGGIDGESLRRAAAAKGKTADEIGRLEAEGGLIGLMLHGGGSTSVAVTGVAGRGIGMDIVRAAVEELGGVVSLVTTPNDGATIELSVPASVSSVEALAVEAGGVVVTLPLDAVRHTLRVAPEDLVATASGDGLIVEGELMPFVPLELLLGPGNLRPRRRQVVSAVVVAAGTGRAAIGVDRLAGTASVVFRSLPELAPASPVIAGASLDGAGTPVLMLDAEGIVAAGNAAIAAAADDANAAPRPILVIDDSLTTRMLEQSILESAGYDVHLATSAEEGLERARKGSYALFLVDVEMPGMDGFAFIEEVRRDVMLRDTPAILVTSRNAPADQERGRAVGAQGYVIKSEFDQADLLRNIARLVS